MYRLSLYSEHYFQILAATSTVVALLPENSRNSESANIALANTKSKRNARHGWLNYSFLRLVGIYILVNLIKTILKASIMASSNSKNDIRNFFARPPQSRPQKPEESHGSIVEEAEKSLYSAYICIGVITLIVNSVDTNKIFNS